MARKWVPWWIERHRRKRALREALRKRDGDNCWRCHQPMRFGPPFNRGKAATIEHRTAQANAGGWELENLVLCHVGCNRHLGTNAPQQKERMRLRMASD
jgi:5-methylcytosine-specific restriction endonuclease McrA